MKLERECKQRKKANPPGSGITKLARFKTKKEERCYQGNNRHNRKARGKINKNETVPAKSNEIYKSVGVTVKELYEQAGKIAYRH